MEQTLTVDDSYLPSPQELMAYKEIDPNIVKFLLEAASQEQSHRHAMDKVKLSLIKKSETRIARINWWGMCFAFLSIVVLVSLAIYALYLDRNWFAGLLGAGTFFYIHE